MGVRTYFCTPKKAKVSTFAKASVDKDLVAQLVEHNTFNVGALGSSPSGITENPSRLAGRIFVSKALK